jgi:hypothetical protein
MASEQQQFFYQSAELVNLVDSGAGVTRQPNARKKIQSESLNSRSVSVREFAPVRFDLIVR